MNELDAYASREAGKVVFAGLGAPLTLSTGGLALTGALGWVGGAIALDYAQASGRGLVNGTFETQSTLGGSAISYATGGRYGEGAYALATLGYGGVLTARSGVTAYSTARAEQAAQQSAFRQQQIAVNSRLDGEAIFTPQAHAIVSVHGNSKNSTRLTTLYELVGDDGTFLKYGISQNPATRYSKAFMEDKFSKPIASGRRTDMLAMERQLVTQHPGPLNREPWAIAARNAGQGR